MLHGTCKILRLGAVLLTGTILAGCSGAGSSEEAGRQDDGEDAAPAPPDPERFEGQDFYEQPDPLPAGEPGSLLRYQPLDGAAVDGGTGWRVMYLSESLEGDPIAVTGVVVVPSGPAPSEGRKLVTIAHGTTGIADECAPSHEPGGAGLGLTGQFVEAGYVVAISDFEGLGTPGRHPYLVGESEGRSVLDAAKAAMQLPEAEVGDRYAIIGYSQGGHGALWANELADEWGPDLDLVGAVAGAPATELPVIFAAGPAIGGFFLSLVAGFDAAYPEADPSLVLTDAGLETLDAVDEGCIGDVFEAVAELGNEQLVRADHTSVEPWATLMEENNPGRVAVDSPVLILHSLADDTVPAGLSEQLLDRMCDVGQTVERRTYDRGQGHVAAAPDAFADGFAWIEGLMDGGAATSSCPAP
ncbi:MAG: lipase family protein [Acidimicrobiales bacterium]